MDLDQLVVWHKDVLASAIRIAEFVQLMAVPMTGLTLLSIWLFRILPMRRPEQKTSEQLRLREAEALDLAERATAANEAKPAFLTMMSHEIRTPMNGVLGLAEVLEREITEPGQKRTLGALNESGQMLTRLLNDILDLTWVESGRLQLEHVPFDPRDIASKVYQLHQTAADLKDIAFHAHVSVRAGGVWEGDPHRVAQVLHNLVSNAIKFTEFGCVDLVISSPGEGLLFEVRDTGIGMTAAETAAILEWFTQADSSTARRFGGAGVGMSIVRKLIETMGGKIEIESAPGAGTRIEVFLPLKPLPEQNGLSGGRIVERIAPALDDASYTNMPPSGDVPAGGIGRSPSSAGTSSGLRVLAVDDVATIAWS